MKLFKKLFGLDKFENEYDDSFSESYELKSKTDIKFESVIKGSTNDIPEVILKYREAYKKESLDKLVNMYFDLMDKINYADKNEDISSLLMHCQISIGLLEPLTIHSKTNYGRFDIKSIPALEKALIYLAINGNVGQLKNIEEMIYYFKELHQFKGILTQAFQRKDLASQIYRYVKENPNCNQSDLKNKLDFNDGRFIATTVQYMVKANKLSKFKDGNKILLKVE